MPEKKQICELIDKLTLDMLDLIEQQVQCKVNIEKRTNEGKLLLAKSRYTQGAQSVTSAQLPTENSPEFNALVELKKDSSDNLLGKNLVMEKHDVDKSAGFIDPINWFGVLVPRCLQFAKERFQKSLELVLECANIQCELQTVMCYLNKLKGIKNSL